MANECTCAIFKGDNDRWICDAHKGIKMQRAMKIVKRVLVLANINAMRFGFMSDKEMSDIFPQKECKKINNRK